MRLTPFYSYSVEGPPFPAVAQMPSTSVQLICVCTCLFTAPRPAVRHHFCCHTRYLLEEWKLTAILVWCQKPGGQCSLSSLPSGGGIRARTYIVPSTMTWLWKGQFIPLTETDEGGHIDPSIPVSPCTSVSPAFQPRMAISVVHQELDLLLW